MTFSIEVATRAKGTNDALRADGKIPAVVYGPEMEPISIAVDYRAFEKLYSDAGESSLIDCVVDGKEPLTVLIQEVQADPVKGKILHIDFRQVKMGEEMSATVELTLVGEAGAVKSLGGTLITGPSSVNVTCLPKNLVSHIDVDLTKLQTFEDIIHISDLVVPEGMTITDNPTTSVAKVIPPLTSDQLEAMETTEDASVEDVAVDGKKKDEDGEDAGEEEKKSE